MSERKAPYKTIPHPEYMTEAELRALARLGSELEEPAEPAAPDPDLSPESPPSPGGPTFLLISLPQGWPPGGNVLSATLIMVRDEVPDQGIAVDTLPVNLDVKAGSLARIKEWLECL